jgi:hypothetical protein
MDSDDTVIDPPNSPNCRLQQMRNAVEPMLADLDGRSLRRPLNMAIGLAVPAIEAWLRCGEDPHVNEAAWRNAMRSGQYPYTRQSLKRDAYQSTRHVDVRKAIEQTRRVAQDVALLESHFPIGFGAMANDLRRW